MVVTNGQGGQLNLLQDSLYFFTALSSTRHSQCVHTSIINRSPACANTHEKKQLKHFFFKKFEGCISKASLLSDLLLSKSG